MENGDMDKIIGCWKQSCEVNNQGFITVLNGLEKMDEAVRDNNPGYYALMASLVRAAIETTMQLNNFVLDDLDDDGGGNIEIEE